MPRQSTVPEVFANHIIASMKAVIPLLDELHDGFGPPFVQAISHTTVALITALQNVKKSKAQCFQLTENIHGVIYAIVDLYMHRETPGTLPPATMKHVAKFTETMHKIHTFVEAQLDSSRIKHFFRQSEMNTLLKDCQVGMQEALNYFKMKSGASILNNLYEMQSQTRHMHQELLELISNLSDGTISDRGSSIYHKPKNSQTSSKSFSMLPARPQIFHGRDSELAEIVQMLQQEYAKIAILGAGGMGKTSLARAALHHPHMKTKYEHCFFVSCESATSNIEIAAIIGEHLGLKPGKNLTKPVLHALAGKAACLLILDNLETTWEPLASRSGVEDLISLLTDIPHLALIVTMRGAERPARVRWTRPFLQPLGPLSQDAARKIFTEIADDFHEPQEVDQLLQFTDNMPLAVDLMAHLVDYEGCANILARQSNLDASIVISLSSPRLTSQPGATDLLSLLSILPDGLSGVELGHSNLPIPNILTCQAVLLGTSLAYHDNKKRLKSLVPIREYMQHFHPAPRSLIQPLQEHFHMLLDMYCKYKGSYQVAGIVTEITLNFGNIRHILQQGLTPQNPDLVDSITCTLALNGFSRLTSRGWDVLMDSVQAAIQPDDHRLRVQFLTELFSSSNSRLVQDAELLASEARSHLQTLNDPSLESQLYCALGNYYGWFTNNSSMGIQCFEKALTLAKYAGDQNKQASILIYPALMKWTMGEYDTGRVLAHEAHSLAKLCGNYYTQANALRVVAMCCQGLGNLKHSLVLLETARDLLKFCGMGGGALETQIRITEAEAYLQKSEYAEAKRVHTEIGRGISEEQEREDYAFVLINLALIDVEIGGNEGDILQRLEMGQAIFSSVGHFSGSFITEMILGDLQLREGNFLAAKKLFQKCLHWGWTAHADVSSYCLERMADIGRWGTVNFNWTSTSVFVYFAFAQKVKQKLAMYKAICFLGDVFLANGDEATAENLFTVALEALTYMDVHRSRGDCMLRLGDIAWRRGEKAGAAVLWGEAGPLFARSQRIEDVERIEKRLAGCEQDQITGFTHAPLRLPGSSVENIVDPPYIGPPAM
ncbi:hypothetical protein B0H14DRAFT_2859997 [Mycena olivaceomarginata]|nr:hypothetical protein B0H14DRAFT_2859997 [Mycena olivaceomarginata]